MPPPPEQQTARTAQDAAALLGLTVTIGAFYGVFLVHRAEYPPGDIQFYFSYLFSHLADRYRAGDLPLWSALYYAGHPFFGNMHAIFYPGDVVFLLLPVPVAFAVSLFLHLLLGGAGMYATARRLGGRPLAGFVAAVLFTCSANAWDHARIGHVFMVRTAMWFPVLTYAWLGLWRGKRRARAITGTALATGMTILAGHPQIFTYALLALGVLTLGAAARRRRSPGAAAAGLLASGVAVGLGCCLAAPQLVPLAELANLTSRATSDVTFAGAPPWSEIGWLHLLWARLAVVNPADAGWPRLAPEWEQGAYVGATALVLVLLGAASPQGRGRGLAGLALLFGVTYALGPHTPVFGWIVGLVPPLARFRGPVRILFVALWGAALLAGHGADALIDSTRARRGAWVVLVGPAVCLAVVAVAVLHGPMAEGLVRVVEFADPSRPDLIATSWFHASLLGPLLSLGAAVLAGGLLRSRPMPARLAPLIGLVLCLNLWFGYRAAYRLRFRPVPQVFPHASLQPSRDLARVFIASSRASGLAGLLTGQRYVDGSGAFLLRNLERYLQAAGGVDHVRDPAYQLNPDLITPAREGRFPLLDIAYVVDNRRPEVEIIKLEGQHAWFATGVDGVAGEDEALAAVIAPDFDPNARVVLLAGDTQALPASHGDSARPEVRLRTAAHERQTWEVTTAAPGVFTISELWYPGWRVYVNGESRPGLRANYLLRGVALLPGTWEVSWRYEPRSYRLGAGLCGLALLVLAGLLFLDRRRRLAPG